MIDPRTRALLVVVASLALSIAPALKAGAEPARVVALAIDTSGSMAGERMPAARDAASDYVRALPADVAVAVVAFADRARVVLEPSTDRDAAERAIEGLRADGDTALHDGVVLALGQEPDRVVVLSDGEDTASTASLADAVDAAQGTPVDVVAVSPSPEHARALRQLAGEGQVVIAADAGSLAAAFAGLATAAASSAPAGPVAEPAEASVAPVAPDARAAVAPTRPSAVPALLAAFAAAAVLTFVLTALGVWGRRVERGSLARALRPYADAPAVAERRDERQAVLGAAHARLRHAAWYARLSETLEVAGIAMPAATLVAIAAVASVATAALVGSIVGSAIVGVLVAGVLAGGVVWWVRSRAARARREFDTELPDLLLLVASGMRSGLSFAQAIDAAANDGAGEVARQLTRVVAETRMGVPIEDALANAADRMRSDDLRWAVTALAMQRQVGGNLAAILETAAASVRGRAELRRELRTLSAEGRLSAGILTALPVAVFAYMAIARREYIDFLWTEPLGIAILVALALLTAAGGSWVRAIVKVEA